GAVILEPNDSGDGRGVLSTHLYADGRFASQLWMEKPCPGDNPIFQTAFFEEGRFFPRMDGRHVFVNACERMPESVRAALAHNGLAVEDIDALIPHQANDRISLMVAKGLKIAPEKVIRNIDRLGNTTAASIPIALDEAVKDGRVRPGHLVALTAFGSGYTWASALIRW
ncbi:MAG TPA: 3-oxoacyl-[acyl-carrier-protein] synthase III C-terminal domain-containing protein, partial [Burkholderiales bacterium]|nr:3-oxoacyl-[acyl-carrier-protein] synthase III C-terminal domain-containing protein [Burkholderiales bacterium]